MVRSVAGQTVRLWASVADEEIDTSDAVWSVDGDADWDRKFYAYTLTVYSNYGDTMLTNTVSDPNGAPSGFQPDPDQFVIYTGK